MTAITHTAHRISHRRQQAFHGIDPDLVSNGSGGSGSDSGIDDHEQLNNLLGGDNVNGHYHVTMEELTLLHHLPSLLESLGIKSDEELNALIDARIREYMANNGN